MVWFGCLGSSLSVLVRLRFVAWLFFVAFCLLSFVFACFSLVFGCFSCLGLLLSVLFVGCRLVSFGWALISAVVSPRGLLRFTGY